MRLAFGFSVCLILAVLLAPCLTQNPLLSPDYDFMKEFSSKFPSVARYNSWTGNPSCDWAGIECIDGRITKLSISKKNTTADDYGTLPASIANLTELTSLSIYGLYLNGTAIPSTINQLTKLTSLYITNCGAGGTFPSISNLRSLTQLSLSQNRLTSPLPDLSQFTSLTSVSLAVNQFNEVLPLNFLAGSITSLESLYLYDNLFSSTLPPTFVNLERIKYLDLSNNRFSGNLSAALATRNMTSCVAWENFFDCDQSYAICCAEYYSAVGGDDVIVSTQTSRLDLSPADSTSDSGLVTSASTATTVTTASSTTMTSATTASMVATSVTSVTSATSTTATSASSSTAATTAATTASSTASSTTSTTNEECSGFKCQCSSNITLIQGQATTCQQGTWLISKNSTNNGVVTVGGSDRIVINGSYTQNSSAVLVVYTNDSSSDIVPVQTNGVATIDGSLVVRLTQAPTGGKASIVVLNATSINGQFSSVEVQQEYLGSKCKKLHAKPVYTASQVLVEISQTSSCSKKIRSSLESRSVLAVSY